MLRMLVVWLDGDVVLVSVLRLVLSLFFSLSSRCLVVFLLMLGRCVRWVVFCIVMVCVSFCMFMLDSMVSVMCVLMLVIFSSLWKVVCFCCVRKLYSRCVFLWMICCVSSMMCLFVCGRL